MAAFAAFPLASAGESIDMEMSFNEDFTEGSFKKTQTWSGEDANKFRTNLDKLFGNADGALDQAEVQGIFTGARNDTAANAGDTFYVDDSNATLTRDDVEIDAQGLVGPVEAAYPAVVTHEVKLRFTPEAGAAHKFNTTLLLGGNITVHAPDGYVVGETEGLVSPEVTEGGAAVTGSTTPGTDLVVHFEEGEPQLNLPGGGNIPGFTLPGALASLAVLALLSSRARRSR